MSGPTVTAEQVDVASTERSPSLLERASAVRLGIWIVLLQDLLFFCGLLLLYVVFRSRYPETFLEGHFHLSESTGAMGVLFLVLGSITVSMGVRAANTGRKGQAVWLLTATFLAGAVFLMLKYGECRTLIQEGLLPGSYYAGARHEILIPGRPQIYFSVLYVLMGCHAAHVLGAMCGLTWVVTRMEARAVGPGCTARIQNVGLFWHLVTAVGVLLFSLYYLI